MARIQSSEVIQNVIAKLRIDAAREGSPNETGNILMPVFVANPDKIAQIARGGTSASSSSTASFFTTPTNKDFFLTSLQYHVEKDASSDNVANTVLVSIDGADQVLIQVPGITLTAKSATVAVSYPAPILLDRGTTIRMSSSFTLGVLIRGLTITGYIVEP